MTFPPAFSENDQINAIIETPRGSRNKYNYEKESGLFFLKKSLPSGLSFPLDFGFIPNTKAEDGDPVDVLVFMDEPGFPGCLVECKVIGIIMAEQEKDKELIRNDRVLAVAIVSVAYEHLKRVNDVNPELLKDVNDFFETYHKKEGNKFKVLEVAGRKKAIELIKEKISHELHPYSVR
jgi:inorganic pyrophosphatase